ncbi:MAG: NAD(P)/FAD-dependent oxidoreductase [Minisyncoccia bacterium]
MKSKKESYKVVVVGSGQAGMFAAYELVKAGLHDILLIDKGRDVEKRGCNTRKGGECVHCKPCCGTMCGVGGAGTYSDGTLNLRPDIGGDLKEQTGDEKSAWELVDYVDSIFLEFGANKIIHIPKGETVEDLKRKARSVGARFIDIKQRHIGSDKAPEVISNFKKYLENNGVEFLLETEVCDLIIEKNICEGVIVIDKKDSQENIIKASQIYARSVLVAPGRVGTDWIGNMIKKHNIKAKFSHIDIGVRVEVPAEIMDPVTQINHDPKFHIQAKTYDDSVRTFCTNEHGNVVPEVYDEFVCINGHSYSQNSKGASENTNFAFVVKIQLTTPLADTNKYGRSIAKQANTIGAGKPIIQRMGDLIGGRRSTEERIANNLVVPTLKDVTPGDISMALPFRIVTDIIEGLETLNEIIPGITAKSTLLYAPEVKFYSMKVDVDMNMETSVKNLFAAGDGAGLSRDIVNAAATGILAARGIFKKTGIN